MKRSNPFFSILTPSYNRAGLLMDVYESLERQSFKDFEWLVVDDGSIDETSSKVSIWSESSSFEIKYIFQENRGKKSAINKGIDYASGQFIVFLDSDDYLVDDALYKLQKFWFEFPESVREKTFGIFSCMKKQTGEVVGGGIKFPYLSSPKEQFNERKKGDRFPVIRKDVLLDLRFPEYEGERFVPEAYLWNDLSLRFGCAFLSEPVCVCRYQESGLSANSLALRRGSPNGVSLYYARASNIKLGFINSFRACINYYRFYFFSGACPEEPTHPCLLLCMVLGWLLYTKDGGRESV